MQAYSLSTITLLLALMVPPSLSSAENREADHDALRQLRDTITRAVNTDNLDLITPLLHDDVSITMVDQTVITSAPQLKEYFDKMFKAEGSILEDVQIEPKADMETMLVSDRLGVNRGSSTDTYTLKAGRTVVLNTRWTSSVIKEDGRWKLLTLHVGVDMLDNPILAAIGQLKYWWGAIGLLLGMIAMFVLGRLLRARR